MPSLPKPNESGSQKRAQRYGVGVSRSHDAVIRVCDKPGSDFETHEHAADFKES